MHVFVRLFSPHTPSPITRKTFLQTRSIRRVFLFPQGKRRPYLWTIFRLLDQ